MSGKPVTKENQPHPDDGARLGEIIRYVMRNTHLDEDRATQAVVEVLNTGLATKRIFRTQRGKYVLMDFKTANFSYKIREPRLSDNSSDSSDG